MPSRHVTRRRGFLSETKSQKNNASKARAPPGLASPIAYETKASRALPRSLSSRKEPAPGLSFEAVSKNYLDRITIEPGKCGGRPCIRGFRLRVKDVLDLLAAGATEQEILSEYDFLEPEDIRACYQYASAQANH